MPLGLAIVMGASHSALWPRQLGPIETEFLAYPARVARVEVLARATKRRLRCPPFPMHGHHDMTLATVMMFMMVEATPSLRQPTPKCRAFHYRPPVRSNFARVERVPKCVVSVTLVTPKRAGDVLCYLAMRQANSTTAAPAAAAMTDVTNPPPSASSTAM